MNDQNTIPSLFENYARAFPEHIAAIHNGNLLTYKKLNKQANQLAHYLQQIGIQADTPIALCLPRSFDYLVAIIAILKVGAAYLPIDAAQPVERLLFLLSDSNAPILITESTVAEQFQPYQGQLVLLDQEQSLLATQKTTNPQRQLSPENLAYIIYTSGSTGMPKGVLIEQQSVINYCQWFAQYTKCQPQQRIDFSSNPIFDMAISVTLAPLTLGLTIVICNDAVKKNSADYLSYLAQNQINLIKLTPSYLKILFHEARSDFISLPKLQAIILGGENLSTLDCQSWLELYPEHVLFNEYGPTETTVAISTYKVTHNDLPTLGINVPIGQAGANIGFMVVNTAHQPVADGNVGELLINGLCLARGYLNQPELTNQQFIHASFTNSEPNRWYKTGDLCCKRADGVLEYFGRIDAQVKIHGFRIEPGEIEKHLAAYPSIKSVAIVSQKDSLDEPRLVAYYVIKDRSAPPKLGDLREFLLQRVPEYMVPSAFIKINFLPLTANGKLDKAALPEPRLEATQSYIEPITDLEKQLCLLWSEELKVQLVGLNDNFFELGGHSLSAARLVSKINHQLKKHITLQDFYQAACINNLVLIIDGLQSIEHELNTPNEIKYHEINNTPLSDFQFLLWMADTFEPKAKRLNIVARKRFQGHLDKAALEFAFQAILQQHEVLLYQPTKFKPIQKVKANKRVQLIEEHIETLSDAEQEVHLEHSLSQLSKFYSWPKNSALLISKLFYLEPDAVELQICMPHLIADDTSLNILFADLSKYYLLYNQHYSLNQIPIDTNFKKYIFDEQHSLEKSLNVNTQFWDSYLQDASFFSFPEHLIVKDMHAEKLPYSTYMKIPKHALNSLKHFCEQNHISINNGLSAILSLSLRNCYAHYHNETPYTVMNIIRSTRDNPIYDHSLGCFLRIESIKIALNQQATLASLSQQIRESTIATSNYQHCSNLVKFSAVSTLDFTQKKIQNFLIERLAPVFTKILQIPPMYRKILQRSIARLMFFKRKTHFIVNLNVRHDFMTPAAHKANNLFGLKRKAVNTNQEDLLAIDYVFEACFLYDDNLKAHYLVISANLKPELKEKIAHEIIHLMTEAAPAKNRIKKKHRDYQFL